MEKTFERKVSRTIISANTLGVEVIHNGEQGGDAGHGGFVNLKLLTDDSYCEMKVDLGDNSEIDEIHFNNIYDRERGGFITVNSPSSITLKFMGDCERWTLIEALEFAAKELRENAKVTENHTSHTQDTFDEDELYGDDELYPIYFNGTDYHKKDCSSVFVAYYTDKSALNDDNGVYVSEGIWVYPDGSTDEN